MLLIKLLLKVKMTKKYIPTEEQLFSFYRFLVFLRNSKLHWFKIELSGSTIVIKAENPEGEIDIRIFYVYEDGEVEPDDFGDRLY